MSSKLINSADTRKALSVPPNVDPEGLKIVKELGSPIPESITVLLSLHSIIRLKERLFQDFGLSESEVLEKLSSIKRGEVSNQNRIDHYLLNFNENSLAFILKRLNRDIFMAKTFIHMPKFLMPQNVKRTDVSIVFGSETNANSMV
ncbi:MAG: hypothetical protein ABSD68_00655 [Candidatus Micrarchaeales archaeon]|jgi:hypothetical protein